MSGGRRPEWFVDWFLERGDVRAIGELRRQIANHLRRHAAAPADVDAAEIVVQELIANAIKHSNGPAWVSLDWTDTHPRLSVYDLGPDFELHATRSREMLPESGSGLFLTVARDLHRAARRAGGNKVTATLAVERLAEQSLAPPRRRVGALPALDEASDAGAFGKSSFLRALVVQLARELEDQQGSPAAEAAVVQVGTDVGGQMEEAYRAARDIAGRLTPAQMADCYVRLKRAIEGDFYVIEVSDERIVLGNRACPFGEAVQRSPGLCRMTSSVFGGIAARNAGGATVILEERIALGDPECRVVVELGERATERPVGHHYPPPADPFD